MIVENLSKMLYENNTHAKCFKMARERLYSDIHVPDLKLRLISYRKTDAEKKDIIIQAQGGQL